MKRLAQQAKAAPFKQPSRRRTPPQRLQQLTVVSLFFFCHMMAKVCAVKREYWLEPCCLAQGSLLDLMTLGCWKATHQ